MNVNSGTGTLNELQNLLEIWAECQSKDTEDLNSFEIIIPVHIKARNFLRENTRLILDKLLCDFDMQNMIDT